MPDISLGAVPGGSSDLKAYRTVPTGTGPFPAVVAIHEAFGLDENVRMQADKLASLGYLTIAPDLYSDGGARKCMVSTFRAMASGKGKAITDIEAARQALLGDPDCNGKVGIIGFCMGGGFALATSTSGFDVAAPNYGMVPRSAEKALEGACPIVASYGGSDPMMMGMPKKLEKALTTLGIEHDVKSYPGVGHSFLNLTTEVGPKALRPLMRITGVGPNPEAAADAWTRIEGFFAEHLSA